MEAAQMATEALRRLLTVLEAEAAIDVAALPDRPIIHVFHELQGLDGWAKVTFERVCANTEDSWALHDLHRSLEQALGLHPAFGAHLQSALETTLPGQKSPHDGLAPSR